MRSGLKQKHDFARGDLAATDDQASFVSDVEEDRQKVHDVSTSSLIPIIKEALINSKPNTGLWVNQRFLELRLFSYSDIRVEVFTG